MTTSVDFDYNGPPVNVSNGMAVQLVAEFGIRNAWFAFLKLRGMKLKNEEAENAHESFTYFRNKIGHLRRLTKELKADKEKQKDDKNGEDLDLLFSADFDNFFVSSDSIELRKDAQQYSHVEDNELLEDSATPSTSSTIGEINSSPTTVSLLQVIEQNKRRQQKIDDNKHPIENEQNNNKNIIGGKTSESEQSVSGEQKDEDVTSIQNKNSPQNTKISRTNKKSTENQETKQMVEKLLAAKEEIARRHAETIDDVVSVVMEKIRNNQPFEGELSAPSGHFIPTKSHHKRAGNVSSGGQKLVQQRSGIPVMGGKNKSDETMLPLRQQQKSSVLAASVPTEGILTSATPTTAFSHFSPGQSIVLLQNPVPSGGSIQIPQSQISFGGGHHHPSTSLTSPTHKSRQTSYSGGQLISETSFHSQQHQQFPTLVGSPVSSPLQGTASRLQQQQFYTIGQPIITGDASFGGGSTTEAIPLEMAIQQNMTVQELIQTLKVQGNRHTNTQIFLQTNANLPSTPTPLTTILTTKDNLSIQNQQETPDSSSQEANIMQDNSLNVAYAKKEKSENQLKKVRRKKKETAENEQQAEKSTIEKTESNILEKQKSILLIDEKPSGPFQDKKPAITTSVPGETSVSSQKQQQRIDDLENQLRKLNKQLLTERNKAATQKKRADKALSDFEKASDSIQLLKIDLACQKTDNNTLISENIALKSENQQLRSKERRTNSGPSTISGISKNRKRKEITAEPEISTKSEKSGGRSRKTTTINLKTDGLPEKTSTPPPLSSELGRRQSKRICVARNQFMKSFF